MARRVRESVVPGKEEIPIGKRSRILSLPFFGLALIGLVSAGLLDVFPAILRFLLVFALFSFLPGELFLRQLFPGGGRSLEIRLPLACLIGLSFFAVVTWVCVLAGLSFGWYLGVLQVLGAVVFAVFFISSFVRSPRATVAPSAHSHEAKRSVRAIYLVIAVLVGCFFFFSPPVLNHQGDSFVHLGYLRSIIAEDALSPGDVLSSVMFDGGEASGAGVRSQSDPRIGTLHPLLSAMAVFSSIEPLSLWLWLPVVLAPVALLGFAAFAAALLPGAWFVAYAVVLFLMFQGGLAKEFLGSIAYGQHLSLVFYWILFVVCLEYAASRTWRTLVVIALVLLGGSLFHIDVAIHFVLMFGAFLVFRKPFGFGPRTLVKLGVTSAICVGVVLVWKVAGSYVEGNVIHSHPQGLLYFFEIGSKHFVSSPAEIVRQNGLLFFTGLLFIPFLPFLRKHSRYGWMSFALCVPPVVVALNPWVAPIVYAKGHYLLHRFLLNIPSLIITSLVIGTLVSWGREGNFLKKCAAVLFLLLWARPFLVGTTVWLQDVRNVRFDRGRSVLSGEMSDVIRFVNEEIPEGSVVLSDAVTSYALSGFSHAKVVAVLGQHGNPNDRYPVERLTAIHTVLSPYTTQIETLNVIERFGMDYVLINGSFAKPVHDFLADWDPKFKPVLEKKFGSFKGVFKRVYRTDRVLVYKVIGTSFVRISWHPEAPFTEKPSESLERCEWLEPHSGCAVTGIRIEPDVALPGEEIRLFVAYRGATDARPSFPLSLQIRFDERAYFDRARKYAGDKHIRRYRERRDAAFRRFRIDHEPFNGYFLPHEWPQGGECYDEFTFRLPTDLNEGLYEVQMKLVEGGLLPNFSLGDFLYNDDSYVGTPCSEIEITKFLIRPATESGDRIRRTIGE